MMTDASTWLYGAGDIRLAELTADASGLKPGGVNQVIIPDASRVAGDNVGLKAEGSQLVKVGGKYYLFNITWPKGGMRTVIVHRADRLTGPYEGRVLLQDRGIAQGSIIDTADGKWYAYMFEDHGAVGRIPYLMPVTWRNGWPVLGHDGKVPAELDIAESRPDAPSGVAGIVAADEFDRAPGAAARCHWRGSGITIRTRVSGRSPRGPVFSASPRDGWMPKVVDARNTLTQRTFGPESSGTTAIDVSHMQDGDCAGLVALQRKYGFVGVKMTNGKKTIVMVSAQTDHPIELAAVPLTRPVVYLRIDCDYKERADLAYFYYSLDGANWTAIGEPLHMKYTVMQHFMGYRFGLFNFATKAAGGYVDFDFFRPDYRIAARPAAR